MKASEFKKLIREEVRKVTKEGYNIPTRTSGESFIEAVKAILPDLRKRIDKAAATVKVTYVEDDYITKQHPAGNEVKVVYAGIKESNKLANAYNQILSDLERYASGRPDKATEEKIRSVISKLGL
jgi:hypothetical protein